MYIDKKQLDDFLLAALREDVGNGDITTLATISEDKRMTGRYIAKEDGILCGMTVPPRVFELVGGDVTFTAYKKDGDAVKKGEIIAEAEGNARQLLTGERVGLNILQRLSGVATRTRAAVEAVKGTNARICDTRKTTPLMRFLEKYAVTVGGGSPHRFHLADGILIKDNHIASAGSITEAVRMAKLHAHHLLKIEVEVESLEQLDEALAAGADVIMLDNMDNDTMRKAVKRVGGKVPLEASGNMGDKDAAALRAVAETGVDLISIGALTHSVKALDISLKFKFN